MISPVWSQTILFTLLVEVMGLFLPRQSAQADMPPIDVGAQVALLRLDAWNVTESGVRGWITYQVTDYLGLDGAFTVFPHDRFWQGGRKIAGVVGLKVGVRADQVGTLGLFGTLRPGVLHFSTLVTYRCPSELICTADVRARMISRTTFVLELGGVLELSPARHALIRFDVGDTLFRVPENSRSVTHNMQFNAGLGYRF